MTEALLFYNPVAGRRPFSQERLYCCVNRLPLRGGQLHAAGKPARRISMCRREPCGQGTDHRLWWRRHDSPSPPVCSPRAPEDSYFARGGRLTFSPRSWDYQRGSDDAPGGCGQGTPRRGFSLGEAGGRYFHLMAGVGADGVVIENVNQWVKERTGVGAYWVRASFLLANTASIPFPVILDGKAYEATFAVIGNARNYGGSLILAPLGTDLR